jgi:hypothetical protein
MSTLYADQRSRRVDLEADRFDTGRRGGIDNVDADTPWRSLAKDHTHRDETTAVPLVCEPFTHPFGQDTTALLPESPVSSAATLRDYYQQLLTAQPPSPEPPDAAALGRALHALQHRWISPTGAARLCGVTPHQLRDDITPKIAGLVAQATKRRRSTREHGPTTQFDPGADRTVIPDAGMLGALIGPAAGHLVNVDVHQLAIIWVARERARIADANSDPDLPRLLWLKYAISRRWTLRAMLAIPALTGWGPGIRTTLRVLVRHAYAAKAAHEQLDDLPASDRNALLGAIGGISLWDPVAAHRGLVRFRNGALLSIERLKASAEPPPQHPGELSEGALKALCILRGWLTCDNGGEPTFRERARRPLKSIDGKSLPLGAVEQWALHADPALIVDRMAHEAAQTRRTDWELAVADSDAAEDTAYRANLARLAYAALTGEEIIPRTFEAAVFWRDPLDNIKWATRLRHIPTLRDRPRLP